MLLTYKENVHSTQMYIPLKPLFSRHKGIGVQFTDEPTGNLDSKATKDVMELFQMLNETQNATILMVTHDSFVASYCKRVLIIKDGQLYQEIVSGGNRRAFQQEIADAMSLLGGEPRDII